MGERLLAPGSYVIGRSRSADMVLDDAQVSREHARLVIGPTSMVITDLGSRNGTWVNSERVTVSDLHTDDSIRIGVTTFRLVSQTSQPTELALSGDGATVILPVGQAVEMADVLEPHQPPDADQRGVVSEALLRSPVLVERDLESRGVEVKTVECAAVGGGMGSLQWADLLRVCGVAARDIAVISNEPTPYGRYQRLCRNSQIPPHERLRSNSDSRPDNVWGFPGYASAEAWRELLAGHPKTAASLLWSIFGEPAIAQTYTPRSGDVFDAIERELARIGWSEMLQFGRVRAIRKTDRGRLVAIVSASDDRGRRHYAVSARFLHMSLGYPAIQLLPDLAEYRETSGDRRAVVNAYEEHEPVYQQLRAQGGLVILRGRGIVASRILQRLWEERRHNAAIKIVHLHRSRLTDGHRIGMSRRLVKAEWEFQPFNWPKSCWTGEQRATMEAAPDAERKRLLEVWGGTTTAKRRDWQAIVDDGAREGWYRTEYGVVRDVRPAPDGKVITRISNSLVGGGTLELTADFVIDCTGLVATPERSPVMEDLIATYGLPKNPLGRLSVTNDFEIEAMRNGEARMFAAGATTLGGPHAAVDSFLGVQYAAYRAVNAIADEAPHVRRLRGIYSIRQWLNWARGTPP